MKKVISSVCISHMLLIIAACLIASCGQNSEAQTEDPESVSFITMSPCHVLGNEEFNSETSFATISDVEFLNNGSIAVLDRLKGTVTVFQADGSYSRTFGGVGGAPGEFVSPDCITVLGDSVVVFDKTGSRISLFNLDGEYLGELANADNPAFIPSYCEATGDCIVGGVSYPDENFAENNNINYMISVFDMNLSAVDTLFKHTFTHVPGDLSNIILNTSFSCSFDVDGEGNMFVAPVSSSDYLVYGISADADTFLTIHESVTVTDKTEAEYQMESDIFTSAVSARSAGSTFVFEPYRQKDAIPRNGIHADRHGRLWVARGIDPENRMIFDVYDYHGEILFIAEIQGLPEGESFTSLWWCASDTGLAAFSLDPVENPVVYVFDLPETT